MASVQFFRGGAASALPESKIDGAIFVVERDSTNHLGDIYVDISNAQRLHIKPQNDYVVYSSSLTNVQSTPGTLYAILDENDNLVNFKVGDGNAYIGDLPSFTAITSDKQTSWSYKINAYTGTEYNTLYNNLTNDEKSKENLSVPTIGADETLVLTRELWLT